MNIYLEKGSTNLVASKTALNLGNSYEELVPNSSGAAIEKHAPVVKVDGHKVEVSIGEVEHPMTDEHLITSIILETEQGFQVENLTADKAPKAVFETTAKPKRVYEYCNLHGLWSTEV